MNTFDQAMGQVLNRSKYNVLTGRAVNIKKYLSDWLTGKAQDLLHMLNLDIPADRLDSDAILNLFLATAFFLLIALLGVLIYHFAHRWRKEQGLAIHELMGNMIGPVDHPGLIARSNHFAAIGNYRESVRYRFIALLLALHANGMITAYPTRTNNQVIDELKDSHPDYYASFVGVTCIFNQIWFGHWAVLPEAFDKYCKDTDQLIREASYEKPI